MEVKTSTKGIEINKFANCFWIIEQDVCFFMNLNFGKGKKENRIIHQTLKATRDQEQFSYRSNKTNYQNYLNSSSPPVCSYFPLSCSCISQIFKCINKLEI